MFAEVVTILTGDPTFLFLLAERVRELLGKYQRLELLQTLVFIDTSCSTVSLSLDHCLIHLSELM